MWRFAVIDNCWTCIIMTVYLYRYYDLFLNCYSSSEIYVPYLIVQTENTYRMQHLKKILPRLLTPGIINHHSELEHSFKLKVKFMICMLYVINEPRNQSIHVYFQVSLQALLHIMLNQFGIIRRRQQVLTSWWDGDLGMYYLKILSKVY